MDTEEFLVLDIETSGGDWTKFPFGFNLLFTGIRSQSLYSFYNSDSSTLSSLADILSSYKGTIVTFNGVKFDFPVLDYTLKSRLERNLNVYKHYDIFAEIKKQSGSPISLDRLSRYTFGSSKLEWDHKHNLSTWINKPELLIDYNKNDLDLTYEIFMRILKRMPLFLDNSSVILEPPDNSAREGSGDA